MSREPGEANLMCAKAWAAAQRDGRRTLGGVVERAGQVLGEGPAGSWGSPTPGSHRLDLAARRVGLASSSHPAGRILGVCVCGREGDVKVLLPREWLWCGETYSMVVLPLERALLASILYAIPSSLPASLCVTLGKSSVTFLRLDSL